MIINFLFKYLFTKIEFILKYTRLGRFVIFSIYKHIYINKCYLNHIQFNSIHHPLRHPP